MTTTVAIDARLRPGQSDGVARFARGLARALREIPVHRLRVVWITGSEVSWLDGLLRAGDDVIRDPIVPAGDVELWRQAHGDPNATLALLRSPQTPAEDPRLPRCPHELVEAGVDVVHFVSQDAFVTSLPSIYHPHDMFHVAFPQFLDVRELGWRELAWRTYARRADVVCVVAPHIRDEVARCWPELAGAIRVIPVEPLGLDGVSVPADPADQLEVPQPFVIYPAGRWLNKNHIRLLEAFSRATDGGEPAQLVLTGFEPDPADAVSVAIRLLGLDDRVQCLGRVSDATLARLYGQAAAVVLPSLYEAGSFPLWEAARAGTRIAASDIPGHRTGEQAVDVWFDPLDSEDMTRAIAYVLDPSTARSAAPTVSSYASIQGTVAAFVDLYEHVAAR